MIDEYRKSNIDLNKASMDYLNLICENMDKTLLKDVSIIGGYCLRFEVINTLELSYSRIISKYLNSAWKLRDMYTYNSKTTIFCFRNENIHIEARKHYLENLM